MTGRATRSSVREHPAPSGALRLATALEDVSLWSMGQGAPSTIRCIKTSRS
ncbi:hypothetical protein HMPREF1550_00263 [Actinomyces sp. oral taxon 877 str. F0543]|nr:hypothetical protein HMPREF1550_00263 [Actinomyces sp. oral taxon 877 str. F0543]